MGTHPNIFKFITELKKEQAEQERNMVLIEAGEPSQKRRPQYVKFDKRLIGIVKSFKRENIDGSYLPYLKSIAHNTFF